MRPNIQFWKTNNNIKDVFFLNEFLFFSQLWYVFKTICYHGDRSSVICPLVDPTRHVFLHVRRLQPDTSSTCTLCDRHTPKTCEIPFTQSLLLWAMHTAMLPTQGNRRFGRHWMGRGNDGVQHGRLLVFKSFF